jgi:hypothetical protein
MDTTPEERGRLGGQAKARGLPMRKWKMQLMLAGRIAARAARKASQAEAPEEAPAPKPLKKPLTVAEAQAEALARLTSGIGEKRAAKQPRERLDPSPAPPLPAAIRRRLAQLKRLREAEQLKRDRQQAREVEERGRQKAAAKEQRNKLKRKLVKTKPRKRLAEAAVMGLLGLR